MKKFGVLAVAIVVLATGLLFSNAADNANAETGKLWRQSGLKISTYEIDYYRRYDYNRWHVDSEVVVSPDAPNGKVIYDSVAYRTGDIEWRSNNMDYYVKLSGDSAFRLVQNDPWDGGATDMGFSNADIVTHHSYVPGGQYSKFFVYPSISKALRPHAISDQGIVLSLELDKQQRRPLLPFGNSGFSHNDKDRRYSENGRYILTTVDGTSLVKVDLLTQKATVIATGVYGLTPGTISNDGRIVVVSEQTTVYDTAGCGDDFDDYVGGGIGGTVQNICSSHSYGELIYTETLASQHGTNFILRNNDTILDGYHDVWPFATSTGVLLEGFNTYNTPKLDYLALGDSYSSGEGDMGKRADGSSFYGSTGGADGCHLSSRSYPFLLGARLGRGDVVTRSVACSGAKVIPDYYGTTRYNGQHSQFKDHSDVEFTEKAYDALQGFEPGKVRQLEFVKEYRPKMITFTGGGNDVGFADIIKYCASSYRLFGVPVNETCAYAGNARLRDNLNMMIDTQYILNKRFIEEVQKVSPETKIYMVGYPQFVKNNSGCNSNSAILNNLEIAFIRTGVWRLNNVLKRVARDTGIHYIDVENSLEGGQICQGSKYMTGPVGAMINNGEIREDSNMYHPNAAGHQKLADRIAAQIKEKPDYIIADIPAATGGARVVRQAVLPDHVAIRNTHMVTMGPGIIGPDGVARIEMFSNAIQLGEYRTDATGALNVEVTIPSKAGIGKHLLAISGKDAAGEDVEVQQFVNVTSGNPDDLDGDGILNEHDPCFAVEEWYVDGKDECAPTGVGITKQEVSGVVSAVTAQAADTADDWISMATAKSVSSPFGVNQKAAQPLKSQTRQDKGDANLGWWLWLILPIMLIMITGMMYARSKRQ